MACTLLIMSLSILKKLRGKGLRLTKISVRLLSFCLNQIYVVPWRIQTCSILERKGRGKRKLWLGFKKTYQVVSYSIFVLDLAYNLLCRRFEGQFPPCPLLATPIYACPMILDLQFLVLGPITPL